jgi:hypothetical protein
MAGPEARDRLPLAFDAAGTGVRTVLSALPRMIWIP